MTDIMETAARTVSQRYDLDGDGLGHRGTGTGGRRGAGGLQITAAAAQALIDSLDTNGDRQTMSFEEFSATWP